MSKFSYRKNEKQELLITGSLDDLLKNLKTGDTLKGKVLDYLGGTKYLIRVRGQNILTESEKKLMKNEEVMLEVICVTPHLTFRMVAERPLRSFDETDSMMNMLV